MPPRPYRDRALYSIDMGGPRPDRSIGLPSSPVDLSSNVVGGAPIDSAGGGGTHRTIGALSILYMGHFSPLGRGWFSLD